MVVSTENRFRRAFARNARGCRQWAVVTPRRRMTKVTRHYETGDLILETIFENATGFGVGCTTHAPPYDGHSMIHRIVELVPHSRRGME